ncbi:MAG TPA: PfkB family carbohydrate kinase [Verrucomicrobiae bacterium]|nr:PfkB family carbohydrate kinase [Verrucomicrobiae bacterium]
MDAQRFDTITQQYQRLRIAIVGDFCLDRYLEIDPTRQEVSIETGLPVHNVVNVRAQPGGAGTVLNNLVALGVGQIFPVGFAGDDGEGYELRWAMAEMRGVKLDYFIQTRSRQTFTYCKPLIVEPGKAPRELSRLDKKNWTPTPPVIAEQLSANVTAVATKVDALILLGQEDQQETGVMTPRVLAALEQVVRRNPRQLILADSRRSLGEYPPVIFKMNASELSTLTGVPVSSDVAEMGKAAASLARRNQQPVFVTLSERGLMGVAPDGPTDHLPALPLRGEIDIVGAGDAVSANLTAALAGGATMREALELANAAGSVVIHQLGTTGTASIAQLRQMLIQ